jgi:hypothetical protein
MSKIIGMWMMHNFFCIGGVMIMTLTSRKKSNDSSVVIMTSEHLPFQLFKCPKWSYNHGHAVHACACVCACEPCSSPFNGFIRDCQSYVINNKDGSLNFFASLWVWVFGEPK